MTPAIPITSPASWRVGASALNLGGLGATPRFVTCRGAALRRVLGALA